MEKIILRGNYAQLVDPSEDFRQFVDKAITFGVKGAYFTKAFKKGWDGKKHLLSSRDILPAGFVPLLIEIIKKKSLPFSIQVADERDTFDPVPYSEAVLRDISLVRVGTDGKPHAYQKDAVRAILGRERGILQIATNGGKTLIAIAAAKMIYAATGKNILFVTHRKQLARQTMRRFKEEFNTVGFIGEGEWRPEPGVTIAIVDSLSSKRNKELAENLLTIFLKDGALILDECLSGETLIQTEDGPKRIDEIKGYSKRVLAFDDIRGKFMWKRVLNWFDKGKQPVIEITHERGRLRCTTDHKILTSKGWKEAWELTTRDLLIAPADVAEKSQNLINEEDPDIISRGINTNPGLIGPLDALKWKRRLHSALVGAVKEWRSWRVLKNPDVKNMYGRFICRDIIPPKTDHHCHGTLSDWFMEPCLAIPQLDTHIQKPVFHVSHTPTASNRNNTRDTNQKNSSAFISHVGAAKIKAMESFPLEGIALVIPRLLKCFKRSSQIKRKKKLHSLGLKIYLKRVLRGGTWMMGRFLVPGELFNYIRRDLEKRKTESFVNFFKKWGFLQKHRRRDEGIGSFTWTQNRPFVGLGGLKNTRNLPCSTNFSRVVSVREIGVDHVYDITTEDLHNFIANGIVVHNCHHAPAKQWYKPIMKCTARFRIGMSGTPLLRGDGSNIMLIGSTGEVISKVSNRDLIEWGFSVEPIILYSRCYRPNLEGIAYREAYLIGVVRNPYRNDMVAEWVEKFVEVGLQVLVLYWEVEHGALLHESIKRRTDKPMALLVGGLTKKQKDQFSIVPFLHKIDDREKAVEQFQAGETNILLASSILDEGMDISNIDALILAAGQKSSIRTLQRIGRSVRKSLSGLEFVFVVDIADMMSKSLAKHSLKRFRDCKKEKFVQHEMTAKEFQFKDFAPGQQDDLFEKQGKLF